MSKTKYKFAQTVASSPEQAKKISDRKVALCNDVLGVTFSSRSKTQKDDIAKKNAQTLTARNLNKVKTTATIEAGIKEYMGDHNVLSIYFKEENDKFLGSCDAQCLKSLVYKKFFGKNAKVLNKYVEFVAHPKSMDETNAPSMEELNRLGINNVIAALAIQQKHW